MGTPTPIASYGPRNTKFQLPSFLSRTLLCSTLPSTTPFVCGHLHSKYGPQYKLTSISYPSSNKTRTLFILCFVPDLPLPTFYEEKIRTLCHPAPALLLPQLLPAIVENRNYLSLFPSSLLTPATTSYSVENITSFHSTSLFSSST